MRQVVDASTESAEMQEVSFKNIERFEHDASMAGYQIFEQNLVTKMCANQIFAARPAKVSICGYCDFSTLCSKGNQ